MKLFADGAKLYGKAGTADHSQNIQNVLDHTHLVLSSWQLKINLENVRYYILGIVILGMNIKLEIQLTRPIPLVGTSVWSYLIILKMCNHITEL